MKTITIRYRQSRLFEASVQVPDDFNPLDHSAVHDIPFLHHWRPAPVERTILAGAPEVMKIHDPDQDIAIDYHRDGCPVCQAARPLEERV